MRKRKSNTVAGVVGADPTLPDVRILLGGKERQLAFDFNAIVIVGKETGINLLKSIVSEFDAANLRALLWAALLKDDPTITLEQVGDLIRPHNIPTIQQAIMTAWFASVDDGGEKTTGEVKAQA